MTAGTFEKEEAKSTKNEGGKHLIFKLEGRDYGVPILTVNEIIGIMSITPIPKAPKTIKGIINLRGKVIPIMDLRLRFDMNEKEHNEETCIIIVNNTCKDSVKQVGIIVDIVSEVVDIPASELEEPPQYNSSTQQDYISCIGKIKDQVVIILDIEKVICQEEVNNIVDSNN